jgi:rhodanese-related sulfurtransferase
MNRWIVYSIIFAVVLLVIYTTYSPYEISHEVAKKGIRSNAFDVILDVRTEKERKEEGFYKGSVHVPEDRLKTDIPKRYPDRKINILVYCATGRRAKLATEQLRSMGYTQVVYIRGTYTDLL